MAAFFVDYMDDSGNKNNTQCNNTTSPTYGTSITNLVAGNGSSSCIVGWFVRWITDGPVDQDTTVTVGNSDAIGVQLIR